jgi:uncharacterized coiled-coil protein SlyX
MTLLLKIRMWLSASFGIARVNHAEIADELASERQLLLQQAARLDLLIDKLRLLEVTSDERYRDS